ncbi:alpha/beta hydrolase-fold protein [uncultured Gordonia sp.]|uniref:alpha/beta hydrolase-fold protein n=3 Tax=unclassified Gordonia (in: high G+C Gram-positive bacteria) TaxID=2657482 RepID=UPI000FC1AB4B|nr:alpha/beta hydrolase-fold protein [uncultured Gordonia sp.]RUP40758.1 MAG: esterase [Gordonia sp. (in: high G+C Gram-positive bacteria)]
MRTSGRRSGDARRRGVAVVCALAAALVLPLAGPAGAEPPAPAKPSPAPAPPKPAPAPNAADKPGPNAAEKPAPPAEPVTAPQPVRVTKTFWYTDRRVALWVHSPAMNTDIQVQLLLARDWWSRPTAKFPQMTMLDGLRAQDDQNGWVINTNIVDFYADKNLNVILPIGGESSFYTDWLQPDRGKTYKWETFLIKELPTVLERDWRSTDVRGIEGLSMGGTAAMMLAARNPGFYKFAASFSGILQMTSLGMQPAIQFAMRDAGGYDSQKMFGLPSNPAWREHDPYLLAEQLRGTSVYISSGNGVVGPHDKPSDLPLLATNYSGVGLELLSRVTSQQFASELNRKGIPGQAVYRPSGTHTWPYWQFEMTQAWPQAASALGLSEDRPACRTSGAIKKVYTANKRLLGECFTPEYSVSGGRAQDFRGGRIITGPKGPKIVGGLIGGAYVSVGGPGGKLGLPTSDERATKDRKGKVSDFQRGKITWTPRTGAVVGK